MTTSVYDTSRWRALSREGDCALAELLDDPCSGKLALHHVRPLSLGGDEFGRCVLVCARHHPMLEALARRVARWRRCPHAPGAHRYPGSREQCERRLNRI